MLLLLLPALALAADPAKQTLFGCNEERVELLCPAHTRVRIVRANYGRFSLSICNSLAEGSLSTQCDSSRETSSILRSRCSGLSSCSVLVTPALFPAVPSCSHTPLYLEVQYECEAGARAGGGQQQPRAGTNMGANISRVWEHGDTGLNPALVERAVRGEIEGSRGQQVPVTEDSEVEDSEDTVQSEDTVTTSLNSPRLATSGQGHRLEMLPDSGDTGADSDGEYDDDIGDSAGAGDSGDGGDGVFSYREVLIISLSSSLLVTLALVTAALSCLHSSRRKLGAGSGPGHGVPDLIPMSGSASAATSASSCSQYEVSTVAASPDTRHAGPGPGHTADHIADFNNKFRHFHPEMLSEHEAALSAEAEAGLLNNNVGAVAEFPVLQLPALPHHHLAGKLLRDVYIHYNITTNTLGLAACPACTPGPGPGSQARPASVLSTPPQYPPYPAPAPGYPGCGEVGGGSAVTRLQQLRQFRSSDNLVCDV